MSKCNHFWQCNLQIMAADGYFFVIFPLAWGDAQAAIGIDGNAVALAVAAGGIHLLAAIGAFRLGERLHLATRAVVAA